MQTIRNHYSLPFFSMAFPDRAIKKVPGEVFPMGKLTHEIKCFETELKSKSLIDLKDLLQRQNMILNNPKLCSKLADKGAKVKAKKEAIEVRFTKPNAQPRYY